MIKYTDDERKTARFELLSYITRGGNDPYSIPKLNLAYQDIGEEGIEKARENAHAMFGDGKHALPYNTDTRTHMLGKSEPFKTMNTQIDLYASEKQPVLITGETGTGKWLVARELYLRRKENGGKFVKFDCSATTESVLESELFGHKKGTYTGASEDRTGLFEEAGNGGTFFIDELSNIPYHLQLKFNGILDTYTIRRLGYNVEIAVDTRIVAATNRDLKKMVESGKFREDLFYRLNCLNINVPPLRKRVKDIPLLLEQCAVMFCLEKKINFDKIDKVFPKELVESLQQYHWPGNVRELKKFVERSMVTGSVDRNYLDEKPTGRTISVDDIITLDENEKRYLESIISGHDGKKTNISQLSKKLGIRRETLREKLEKYGIAYSTRIAIKAK
jgi:transcriptional regulator with PAS, ATPase and Fis domain